ncbi:DNA mismatch repair protein MutS [Pinisolibacter aquiterrae]|uniref:DNA mismatch repair protein MutS n=1 Tax=Pinisolibacter aquiterrae TaxID=2815579 RepID=UPI001C3C653C|nr:DNA mismatch repair protein MutS [Pinisolibacter aquiterrae]MCC8236237.1 DNA mismatch repair protein MutS [Pinisolibacter aquiterrae]
MSDAASRDDADPRPTPVMEQFLEIKAANPDSLLFYRMGDFYELFFGDAEEASRALGIVLTKRGKHLGEDIPMCGVPVVRADEYLQRLIGLGFRVAVCEQLEDPAEARKRGSKAVVRRDVVRLVTPGTITEDTLLDAGRANHLLAIARVGGEGEGARWGLAWVDVSSGSFRVLSTDLAGLSAEIARIEPREIVLAEKLFEDEALKPLIRHEKIALTPVSAALFDGATAEARIAAYFEVAALDGFGRFERAELSAISGVVAYVEKTQVGLRARLEPPRREGEDGGTLSIDPGTRANLEIMRTLSGERRGSLLAAVDRCVTPNGQRLLAERLAGPSTCVPVIGRRADAVAFLLEDPSFRRQLREALASAPDMLRPLGRLALQRGGPRDLAAIGAGLTAAGTIGAALARLPVLPEELARARDAALEAPQDLAEALATALVDEPPLLRRDGGFVRAGWSMPLDEARELSADSRRLIARLEGDYVLETGIKSLKIRHNNVLGFFVDTTPAHADKLTKPPLVERFVHRQTLANAVRFSTVELSDLEAKIASAGERALGIENEIFEDLAARVLAAEAPIRAAAEALAILDVAASFAEIADAEGWVRPIVEEGLAFRIEGGRHPVVEQALRAGSGEPFVANDCDLGPRGSETGGRLILVTGPNMGGKSTYLRQNALIVLLAQVGAFVPARAARIGVVDKLFSRVGAADDLARGRSTFMVEMVETAAILNQAGRSALVILDEIGRGTATFDGLSIAWATIEHLNAVNGCRALFATHYHELTALADRLPRVANVTSAVREWKGDVVFLHEIVAGAADRSYGIQVARLAGLPAKVIDRARQVLRQLEEQDRKRPKEALIDELPLFSALKAPAPAPVPAAVPREDPRLSKILEAIAAIDPDDLTPRAALDALYALKARVRTIEAGD